VEIVEVTGAAEIMPYMGVSDFIVDLVSSGSTLKTNRLVEIQTILESEAVVLANHKSLETNEHEISGITNAILSVMNAETKKYLMADVPRAKLGDIEKALPGLAGPTVMELAGTSDMVAIHVVVDNNEIYDAVNKLKEFGGTGILTLPIERLVQ
jgi:ATP phosphoribosyltransferase